MDEWVDKVNIYKFYGNVNVSFLERVGECLPFVGACDCHF